MPALKARSPVPVSTTARCRVGLGLGEADPELAHQLGVEGVAGLRSVEAQDEHGALLLAHEHGFGVGHLRSIPPRTVR